GGLIIQVGDTVYDSSLRSRLQQLRGRLVEKALNEIQSGRDRFSHTEGN
ncbi:MAG: F0F1 ATP synthase subunit delta, partial [Planctomycetaceae bacterium]|nr:F0F1 ATP synthase subunit delta [Planctomycetaceae bacterium]